MLHGTYTVRVPASGGPYVARTAYRVPCTVAPQVAAAGLVPPGTVAVCMGGAVVDCRFCRRDTQTHRFVDVRWG